MKTVPKFTRRVSTRAMCVAEPTRYTWVVAALRALRLKSPRSVGAVYLRLRQFRQLETLQPVLRTLRRLLHVLGLKYNSRLKVVERVGPRLRPPTALLQLARARVQKFLRDCPRSQVQWSLLA